jgi:hypothetical protein
VIHRGEALQARSRSAACSSDARLTAFSFVLVIRRLRRVLEENFRDADSRVR